MDFLELGFFSIYGITDTQVLIDAFVTLDYVNAGAKFDSYSVGPTMITLEYEYIPAVPVPSAVWLFGSGLIGLIGLARRKS